MAKTAPHWSAALAKALPRDTVSTAPTTLAAHAGDSWFASHLPEAVVFADCAATVAATLRFASAKGIPVTARGAGKGYVGGCVPACGGIVVSTERLNRIVEIHKADGVAVVQPGVITGQLQEAVRKLGLFYPPDPASLKDNFLGGNVSTNAGGPRCLKYGVTRNYVLGLQVALADGSLVRVGGRTHKNKTGFDLVGIFAGSEGMLGIITEITLKLIAHPPTRSAISAVFNSPRQAAKAVQSLILSGIGVAALEVADSFTLAAARARLGDSVVPKGKAHLLSEIDGTETAVADAIETAEAIVAEHGATHITSAHGDAGCEKLWSLRREFSASLKATGLTKLNEDITVPRSRLVDMFTFGATLQKKHGIAVACFGHAGDGNIHTNIMADFTQPGVKKTTDIMLDELFDQVLAWGGTISGEHGIGIAKKKWWPRAASPELRTLHATVKNALDPQGILNPGKFLG